MERRTRRDGPAELQAEGQPPSLRDVGQGDAHAAVGPAEEATAVDELIGIGQRDAGARRPTTQCGETERIIGEEEVLDRIGHALLRAFAAGVDEAVRAGFMRRPPGAPFRSPERDLTGGGDAQSKRR